MKRYSKIMVIGLSFYSYPYVSLQSNHRLVNMMIQNCGTTFKLSKIV